MLDFIVVPRAPARYGVLERRVVTPVQVREAFARMLGAGAAVALADKIARNVEERVTR